MVAVGERERTLRAPDAQTINESGPMFYYHAGKLQDIEENHCQYIVRHPVR